MILLTAAQAAERLSINKGQFRSAVRRGEIPPPAIRGNPHFWYWPAIENWLAGHRPADVGCETPEVDALMEQINALPD